MNNSADEKRGVAAALLKAALLGFARMHLRRLPLWIEAIGAGVFISSIIEKNPSFRERLKEIDGKVFLFEAKDIGKAFYLHIKDGDIRLKPHMGMAPDVRMRGDVDVLMGLILGKIDPDTVFFSRRLEIEGDTAAAIHFKNILQFL